MYKRRIITLLVLSLFFVVSTDSSGKPAPKPAPKAELDGPYLTLNCESWTRLHIRCTAVTFGAWAPHTVRWYVDGVFYKAVGDLYPDPVAYTSVTFACSPSRPSVYSVDATDSIGGVSQADPSNGTARCLTGNP